MAWNAEHVRLTLFPAEPTDTHFAENWFETGFGQPPATVTYTGATLSAEAIGRIARDDESEVTAHLAATPARNDWRVLPVLEGDRLWVGLGEFEQAARSSAEWMRRAAGIPALRPKRVAFGAVLLRSVPTRQEGYIDLQQYLPKVALDPEGTEDFLYQVNRPRELGGIRINRLVKFSVARRSLSKMSFGPSGADISQEMDYATRLELDINTAADRVDALPNGAALFAIVDGLVEFATEISRAGDIP